MARKRQRSYIMRVLVAFDQFGNALTGGYEDETISSRLGKYKLRHGGVVPRQGWGKLIYPLDWVLEKLDPGHAVDAIELDEGDGPTPE